MPSSNREHEVETGLEPKQFDFRGHTLNAYVMYVVIGAIIIFIAVFLLFPSLVGWRESEGHEPFQVMKCHWSFSSLPCLYLILISIN